MTIPTPSARRNSPRRFAGLAALALVAFAALLAARSETRLAAAPPPSGQPKETLVGGRPLWADWPKNQKPAAVIVFTGQTFGYLQPCGCSRPQTGGLERRAVLFEQLRAKGWPVAGIDLGDLYAEKTALEKQGLLKYATTMHALREMGYLAVGVGLAEIKNDLWKLIAEYSLQKEQRPFMLAANVTGTIDGKPTPRETYFRIDETKRPFIEAVEVGKVGDVTVGVAGVVGKAVQDENAKQKWDKSLDFPNAKLAITGAAKELAKHKPQLNVLIFQGPIEDVVRQKGVAEDFPEFQVILCQSEDLAPQQPQVVQHKNGARTLVVTVGHRGQHVGVLGAFPKTGGGFDFHYQLVPLGEEFITPGNDAQAAKTNKTLQLLEDYAQKVKAANLLPKYPRTQHAAQIHAAGLQPPVKLTYVGSDACQACHAAEHNVWKKNTAHSHAMATLEKMATRPSLRNFDGECVVCHTVGFKHSTGAYDPKNTEEQNKLLHNVGCESCHGPGSGHVAQPKNKDLLALLSPWKQQGAAPKMPDAAFMKKIADTSDPLERGKIAVEPAHLILIRGVVRTCIECHDNDADPKFDIYKSWPKIDHSGLAPKGGWPAVPPKQPAQPQVAPKK
jgi:hypothetical protein